MSNDDRAALYERRRHLTKELRDRDIRPDLWATITEEAAKITTLREMDDYLDRMEADHSKFL